MTLKAKSFERVGAPNDMKKHHIGKNIVKDNWIP